MDGSSTVELVLLHGGRTDDDVSTEASAARGALHVVRDPGDLQAALEETVAASRRVRHDIEARIAAALDELLRAHAPEPEPR